ncbi:hypothetical protein Misp06_03648 [Microbulbifer sp. NBRC 101763]|uniref:hypothetical protein n=1 Tax=Microbulbifer sp. NBRC 101763 TaxID=1113820 RepID=UPI0030AE1F09
MNFQIIKSLFWLSIAFNSAHTQGFEPKSDFSVNLERVRYCQEFWCLNQDTLSEYRAWEVEGVSNSRQLHTQIARVQDPVRDNVKNLVFIAAGQQPPGNGAESSVTGQKASYKKDCGVLKQSCSRSIDGRSLARQLLDSEHFPTDETFLAIAFDTQFNQMISSNEKSRIERAYLSWLKSKAYASNLETIYLAGSSRGGCLVMRLAKAMRADPDFRNIRTVVHSFDGVCKWTQNELGLTSSFYRNPMNSSYLSYYTDLHTQFPYKDNLYLRQLTGGAEVIELSGVHSFAYTAQDTDLGWYSQRWVNLDHTTIGRDMSQDVRNQTIVPFLQHLDDVL